MLIHMQEDLRARRRAVERLLDQVIDLAFPLHTYPELKRLFRARCHLFYEGLYRGGMRRERVARLAGLTLQGLHNLGAVRPPSLEGAEGERLLLRLLEGAGPAGCEFRALAEAYEARSSDDGGLEEALHRLVKEGRVARLPGARYTLRPEDGGVLLSVSGQAALLILQAAGPAGLTRAALLAALRERGLSGGEAALAGLLAEGAAREERDRVVVDPGQQLASSGTLSAARALSAVSANILDALRQEQGAGPSLASGWSLSLPADPEAQWALLAELRARTAAWADEAERHGLGSAVETVEIFLGAARANRR